MTFPHHARGPCTHIARCEFVEMFSVFSRVIIGRTVSTAQLSYHHHTYVTEVCVGNHLGMFAFVCFLGEVWVNGNGVIFSHWFYFFFLLPLPLPPHIYCL